MTGRTILSGPDITDDQDEDLIHTKTFFRRHSKGPIMFNGCSPAGDVIIIDNISTKRHYNLTGWYIERETDIHPTLRYIFTNQFIIPPLTTVELWASTATPIPATPESQEDGEQQQSFVCIKSKVPTWNSARQWSVTRLINDRGQEKAIFSHRTLTPIETDKPEEEKYSNRTDLERS